MIIVGLTGGIATGKSTVSAIFQKAGAFIIDADVIAHQVIAPGLTAWRSIKEVFGDRVMSPDGSIDRAILGELVFKDQALRSELEAIVHPEVRIRMNRQLDRLRRSHPRAVVVEDIPLLIETRMTQGLDEIILVFATPELQLHRLMQRDSMEKQVALDRIHAQMPIAEKRRHATIVIDNCGLAADTEKQALNVFAYLVARAEGHTHGPYARWVSD